jgi:transcriptional regulator with XRE-family HTH domain
MSTDVNSTIGARLRDLRLERGYTLGRVAEGANISKSFLALVEQGKSDITITRLMRLTRFYGVHISDVLPDAIPDDEIVVLPGEGQRVYSPRERIDVSLLTKRGERTMSPILAVFAPAGESEPSTHEGEEFLYVLSGTFELKIGDGDPIVIPAGGAAHFAGTLTHTYKNIGDEDGQVLSVVTPAIF